MSKKLIRNVSFRSTDDELELFRHAGSKRNFSEWVKQKLEEDMEHRIPVVPDTKESEVDEDLF